MTARSIEAGRGHVTIGLRSRIAQGSKNVQRDLDKLGTKVVTKGQGIARAGMVAAAASAGLLAAPLKAASSMQETMSKFDTVFGASSASMKAWSDNTAESMGASRREMAGMLSGMQDLLVPMGVASGTAEGMSKQLSTLAVDLGSFNNMSTDQVFGDLMAAMTGSGEVMKKYGVILSESAVKQELLNQGLDPKTADDAAKAQARLNIIMAGTTAAQGDAVRTSESLANQTKRLWSRVEDLSASIGGPLIETVAGFVQIANSGIASVVDWTRENSGMVKAVGLAVLAVGGLGVGLVGLGTTLTVAGVGLSGIASGIAFLASPAGLAVAAVAGLGYSVVKYTSIGAQAVQWLSDRFGPLVESVKNAAAGITEAIRRGDMEAAWQIATSAMEIAWLDMSGGVRDAWSDTMTWVLDRGSDMASNIGKLFEGLGKLLTSMLDGYEKYYNKVYNWVVDLGGDVSGVKTIGGRGNAFEQSFGDRKESFTDTIDQIRAFGVAMRGSAEAQKAERAKETQAAKDERKKRLDALREQMQNVGDSARSETARREAKEVADSLADKLKSLFRELEKETMPEGGKSSSESEKTGTKAPDNQATFSAFGAMLSGLGPSGSAADRTAKASEESADWLQKIAEALGIKDPAKSIAAGAEKIAGLPGRAAGQAAGAIAGVVQNPESVGNFISGIPGNLIGSIQAGMGQAIGLQSGQELAAMPSKGGTPSMDKDAKGYLKKMVELAERQLERSRDKTVGHFTD